jgi:6-phosphogluconolactonase (cycloisomerase 2 family)
MRHLILARRVSLFPASLLAMVLAGCGGVTNSAPVTGGTGNTPAPVPTELVITANFSGNSLSVLKVNASNNDLSLTNTVTDSGGPHSVVVSPTAKFAYVANFSTNTIGIYSIDTTAGQLTLVNNQATLTDPYSLAVDPTGKFLYAVTNNDALSTSTNYIIAYQINATTGGLTPVASYVIFEWGVQVYMDPKGRFVYVMSVNSTPLNDSAEISSYKINTANGSLTYVGGDSGGEQNPIQITGDPTGSYLYTASTGIPTGGPGGIFEYKIDQSTGLASKYAFLGGGNNYGVVSGLVDRSSNAYYALSIGDNKGLGSRNLVAYPINPTNGVLNLTTSKTVGAGTDAVLLAQDLTSNYIFEIDADSNQSIISEYYIPQPAGSSALIPYYTSISIGANPVALALVAP